MNNTSDRLTEEQNRKFDSLTPQGRRIILVLSLLGDEKETRRMARQLARRVPKFGIVGARKLLDTVREKEREMRRENNADWWRGEAL